MTKEKQEDIISNQIFHQWKQHDCTKALINLIKNSIDRGEKFVMEHVKESTEINVQTLSFYKGVLIDLNETLDAIHNKQSLELYINNEEEK